MHRLAYLFLLLCSTVGFSQNLPQWKVVRQYHVVKATDTQGELLLFTAKGNTLYRVTEYISGVSNSLQNAGFGLCLDWTDQNGLSATGLCSFLNFSNLKNLYSTQPATPFSPVAGTNVYVQVEGLGNAVGVTYDAVLTVEQLTTN